MSTYKPLIVGMNPGHVDQLDDPDGLAVSHLDGMDYIDFDLTPNIPGHQTGRLHWHETDGTLSLGMVGSEVELQIGQEHLILVKNITGNTINNGTPVYFTGIDSGRPTVATANAARAPSPVPTFVRGLLTETINTGNEGYMLVAGLMRDVDTANWAPNTQLYLDIVAGQYTGPSRPEAPDNVRGLGVVVNQHATEGSILVSLDPIYDLEWGSNIFNTVPFETDQFYGWQPTGNRFELLRSQRNFFNGTTRESFDATVNSVDATTIQLYLEQSGGGNLTMQFTDGDTQLVCDPTPQTINITPGTDISPAGTMVYIPLSTKLPASSGAWPDEEHIKVCYLSVPSAQFVFDHGGPYVNQNWNDHLSDTAGVIGQGHLSHIAGKIRLGMGANWYSGVNPEGQDDAYFTFPASSTIYWESSAGVIAQLHTQNFGAKDTGNGNIILVANDSVAAYSHIDNLFTGITLDSTGNAIGNNRYFSLIFWGVQNKTDQGSGVMVNLPAGNYTSELSATLDTGGYDDYNFPREFTLDSGTAFLICRSTFKMGTTGWTHIQTEDLRGKVPSNQVGGGAGGGITDHGALGGLTDVADHPGYVLVDGTRNITGEFTFEDNVQINGTLNASNYPASLFPDGVLTSNDINVVQWASQPATWDWPTSGTNNQLLVSVAGDDPVWTGTPTVTGLAATTIISTPLITHASGEILIGTANLTVNGSIDAESATIDNIHINDDQITSTTGTVNFDDDVEITGNLTVNTDAEVQGDLSVDGTITVNGNDVMVLLTADLNINVKKTGNDTTGDGTSSFPYLTVARAVEELKKYNPAGNLITVIIDGGAYTEETFLMDYFSGGSVTFTGSSNITVGALAVSNIDGSPTPDGHGLEYFDFEVTLPGTFEWSADYGTLVAMTASGGTNPNLILGACEVVAWDSGTRLATCRMFRRVSTSGGMPSGAVSIDTSIALRVRLNFDADHGVIAQAGQHGGIWTRLAFYGLNNTSLLRYGFLARRNATLVLGPYMVTHSFYYNVYCRENSTLTSDRSYHTASWQYHYHCNWAASMYIADDIACGSLRGGVHCQNGSVVTLQNSRINAFGTIAMCLAESGSFINADCDNNGYHASAPAALVVHSGGGILSDTTTSDLTPLRSTPTGNIDNGAYHAF